jgi:subtilisin family serine protease
MNPKKQNNPKKKDLIHSGKILLEVEQKMAKGEMVDVIIGKRDFIYVDPNTGNEVDADSLIKKKLEPEKYKKKVTTQMIKDELEKHLGKNVELGKYKIVSTEFFVSARLDPKTIREIVGEVEGVDGIKGIQRIWLNKKTEALLNVSNHTIKATAARNVFNVTGKGICWAVIDSGIDKDNDLITGSIIDSYNFTDEAGGDKNGHGTHVAGIIASRSNDYPGIAPETKLYDFKVLDQNGQGNDFNVIQAMERIRQINFQARELVIHGANISLGSLPVVGSYGVGQTPICQEANRLMRSGVVVVVAAGNDGHKILAAFRDPTNIEYFRTFMDLTISDPGNAEDVITVGSVHKENPHMYGISYFSAKGPTGDGRYKPDVVAPGERILSLGLAINDKKDGIEMSGTSMAAPHASGAIALFLSAKKEFIGESLKVKEILMSSCTDLKRERYFQGMGLIDILRTIQAL